jgi:hypothetical protein
VADLLIGAQDDAPVLVAIEPNRQGEAQLAALSLAAQPAVQPRADEVQLGLGHRALQPQQQPVVEIDRRIDAVGVGDQGGGQRAQVQQLMPVRRGARQPRDLQRQHHADVAQPDLGHQLLEPNPPRRRGARTTGVPIDDHHALLRPAELDGAIAQRILARRRLRVALDLPKRGLAHIHHRAPATMRLGDLRAITHRARPPAARQQPRQPQRDLVLGPRRQRLPHRRRRHRPLAQHQRQLPGHPYLRFHRRLRRAADDAPAAARPAQTTAATRPATPTRPPQAPAQCATEGRSSAPGSSPRSRRSDDSEARPRRPRCATPAPPTRRRAARPVPPPAAPAPATDPQHE